MKHKKQSKEAEISPFKDMSQTFPVRFLSLRCHFHSLWTALEARANRASPELV